MLVRCTAGNGVDTIGKVDDLRVPFLKLRRISLNNLNRGRTSDREKQCKDGKSLHIDILDVAALQRRLELYYSVECGFAVRISSFIYIWYQPDR